MLKQSEKRVPWLILFGLAIVGWVLCRPHLVMGESAPPNLILIMADDLGARELPSYGNQKHVMPTLDRLADEGVQFAMAFSTPICRASRMEILTGQYGFRNRVFNNSNRRGGGLDGDAERIRNHLTLAQILRDAGYATAMAGKWGLSGRVPTLVVENGFDEYMIYAVQSKLPPGVEHTGAFQSDGETSPYWHPAVIKNGEYVTTEREDYGPDLFNDFLIDFVTRHRDQPFFLYYPMVLPHAPFWPTPLSISAEKERFASTNENFSPMVEYIDVLVSRLVQVLRWLGLRDNTVIIFTADNGSPFRSASTGTLGGKGRPTQLGARVPMIVNAPSIVKPLGVSRDLVDLTDILPTLVDFAAFDLPSSTVFDGHSFAPLLQGEPYTPREWIFSYLGDRRLLRTQRWLLENNSPHQFGQLFDCGHVLNREDCMAINDFTEPEVMAVKSEFQTILANLPAPLLPIRINFQPEKSPFPSANFEGDIDYGQAFMDHSQQRIGNQMRSGISYGWPTNHTAWSRDRDLNRDQRLDTFVTFLSRNQWEIALANGDYRVAVVLGDAALSNTPTLNVEGVNYWHAVPLAPNQFLHKEMTVSVTDGRLTLDTGDAPNFATRINYVEIIPINDRKIPQESNAFEHINR